MADVAVAASSSACPEERGPGKLLQQSATETPGFPLTTSDQELKVALCCLLFLRALRLTGGDFFLVSSDAHAGKFDDVILLYRLEGEESRRYRAILLQAKHQVRPFRLDEHLAWFANVRNLWEQPVQVQRQPIHFREISLVLYTDAGGDWARDVTASPEVAHLRDMLNAGGRLLRISDARRAGLPPGPDTADFIEHLVLCTEQAGAGFLLDRLLQEEMSDVLKLTSADGAMKLVTELKHAVGAWRREGEGRYLCERSEEWKRVLELEVTRLNADTLTIQSRLDLDLAEADLEEFKSLASHRRSWVTVRDQRQAEATRVMLLKALESCAVLDAADVLESQLADEVDALWGTAACQTLVLDMSAGSRVEEHLTALGGRAGRNLVVIARGKPTTAGAEAEWRVLEASSSSSPLLGPRDVISSDRDVDSPGASPKCHVPRCIQRSSPNEFNLDKLRNRNSLIILDNVLNLAYADLGFKISPPSDLRGRDRVEGAVLLAGPCSDSEIRNMCCKFGVPGISGSVGEKTNLVEFFPFTWMCEEKDVVVEGAPGVGKSSFVTEMCSRVKERFPESRVLRVDMGKLADAGGDVGAFLLKDQHSAERDLLESCLYVTGNVFLFADAFDEVSPNHTARCCDLLKGIAKTVRYRQMVVTTRPCASKALEEALGTKAFTLPVFSEDEQRTFLDRCCRSGGRKTMSSLRQAAGTLLEIPLHLKMAADVQLRRDDQISLGYEDPWKKVSLFKLFVEQTVEDRVKEKLGEQVPRLLDSAARNHLNKLQSLAARKLMPVRQLPSLNVSRKLPEVKLGLVVVDDGGGVEFEHQTLAEYFLGRWLARNWRQCPRHVLRQALSRDGDGDDLASATLSWSLLEGLPLHEAVARGDEDAVRAALMTSAGASDRGGRTALHVAAMTRGRRQQAVVVELLLAAGGDPRKRDDVFGATAITYAQIFANWEFLEKTLERGMPLKPLKAFRERESAKKFLVQVIERNLTRLLGFISRQHWSIFLDSLDGEGNSPLHVAANAKNSIGTVRALLEMGHRVNFRNADGRTPLHESSKCGFVKVVRFLLANGADPNVADGGGRTPLMSASSGGHLAVVKLLLRKGADVDAKTRDGFTALTWAARDGHGDVVELLTGKGADVNDVTDLHGDTPLMLAAEQGRLEVVRLLLMENGADPDAKNANGHTSLMLAAHGGHLEVVKLLLENGAEPNATADAGCTALKAAASRGHAEVVRLLLENGGDPEVKADDYKTTLMLASHGGHLEVVRLLLENGAEPNMKAHDGCTALKAAASRGHAEVVKLLLENGADPDVKAADCKTALMLASHGGDLEVVRLLLQRGAQADVKAEVGNTSLMMAAHQGHHEIVKMLLEAGADPNVKDAGKFTSLMFAADEGHLEVVKLLVENGAEPNATADAGCTALKAAASRGHVEVVRLLLERGAQEEDAHRQTALMLASHGGHLEVVKLLLLQKRGTTPNKRAADGKTALMLAASRGHLETVRLLLLKGGHPNTKDNHGHTATILAASEGHAEVVKLLLDKGAKLNANDKRGRTALMMAADQGHPDVVRVLLENGADRNAKSEDGHTAVVLAVLGGHLDVVTLLI